jgi:peptidoglycan/LPS O-acetylase OafA/YrhL
MRIPSLDGLRGIAILLVIVCHLTLVATSLPNHLSAFLAGLGGLGVRIFFVLSGLLITSILLEEKRRSGIRLGRFYIKRTMRIFPPYYFMIWCLTFLGAVGWVQVGNGDILSALTYTANYHVPSWALGHAWSLSVEEQFYLLWPACLLLLKMRTATKVAIFVVIVCPLIRYAYWLSTGNVYTMFRFESIADSLAVGCLLACRPLHRNFSGAVAALIVLGVLGLNYLSMTRLYDVFLLLGVTLSNFGIAISIHWAVMNHEGRVGRLLNSRVLSYVGIVSYSIYLWQQVFLNPEPGPLSFRFPINLLLVAGASLFSFYVVERPSLRFRQWVLS